MAKRNAFTLIELLVVIAIIAILAAVVLVSLGGAQDRARDARITSDMNQIRNTAEIFASNHGDSYTGLNSDPDEGELDTDITTEGGTYTILINATDGDGYCAVAKMNSGFCWCVDGNLRSRQSDATVAGACTAAGPLYGGAATACLAATCEAADSCACY